MKDNKDKNELRKEKGAHTPPQGIRTWYGWKNCLQGWVNK